MELNENQRVLARVIQPHKYYKNVKEGAELILGPTFQKCYYHPDNCLAYDKNGKMIGRYKWEWFEVIATYDSFEELLQANEQSEKSIEAVEAVPAAVENEQLSLFNW